jgi:hypothetical protein
MSNVMRWRERGDRGSRNGPGVVNSEDSGSRNGTKQAAEIKR